MHYEVNCAYDKPESVHHMLLDVDRKFVLICVPRTAGRSVERWFKYHLKPMPVKLPGGFHRTRVPNSRKFAPKRGWLYIAGIRHPLDRLVSYYHVPHIQRDIGKHPGLQQFPEVERYLRERTFENFVRIISVQHTFEGVLERRWGIDPVVSFLLRSEYPMTHYIRYESMEADMEALPFVSQKVVLEEIGKSDRRPLAEYYRDPETLELALQWGEEDCIAYYYEPTLEAACALRGESCILQT